MEIRHNRAFFFQQFRFPLIKLILIVDLSPIEIQPHDSFQIIFDDFHISRKWVIV